MRRLCAGVLVAMVSIGTSAVADISLLAAGGNAPFADPEWPHRGLATELVETALKVGPDPLPHSLAWQQDVTRHPDILTASEADIGYPWIGADCDGAGAATPVCRSFHFSDPIAEVAVLLFTTTEGEFDFRQIADLESRRLCRPARHYSVRVPSSGPYEMREAASPAACFSMLVAGDVDAVAIDEFLGVQQLFALGLTEKVVPLPRPFGTQTLHAVISRTHWRGTTHLYRINAGLARLRGNGGYAEILDRHLTLYWDEIKR